MWSEVGLWSQLVWLLSLQQSRRSCDKMLKLLLYILTKEAYDRHSRHRIIHFLTDL